MKTILFAVLIATAPATFAKNIKMGSQVIAKGYLQALLAKEVCTCHFVTGLEVRQCLERANLPISQTQLKILLSMVVVNGHDVKVSPTPVGLLLGALRGPPKQARYFGEGEGCRLVPYEHEPLPERDSGGE